MRIGHYVVYYKASPGLALLHILWLGCDEHLAVHRNPWSCSTIHYILSAIPQHIITSLTMFFLPLMTFLPHTHTHTRTHRGSWSRLLRLKCSSGVRCPGKTVHLSHVRKPKETMTPEVRMMLIWVGWADVVLGWCGGMSNVPTSLSLYLFCLRLASLVCLYVCMYVFYLSCIPLLTPLNQSTNAPTPPNTPPSIPLSPPPLSLYHIYPISPLQSTARKDRK